MYQGTICRPHLLLYRLIPLLTLLCDCESAVTKAKKPVGDWDVNTDDFRTLIGNGVYVDKSLLINETLKCEEKVLQITRPRKWGKTLNLDMLRRFFEIELDKDGKPLPEEKKVNPALFRGGKVKVGRKTRQATPLKVSGYDDVMGHMGKHPVIYVNLKDVKGKNYIQFEESLKNIVAELFLSFPFLKDYLNDGSDVLDMGEKIRLAKFITRKVEDQDFICCFEFLSLLLYKHFHSEVCLFIDDYDLPIINAFLEFGDKNREFDSIVIMLRVLFENAFKENQYLLKGIITGTLNFFVVASGISEYHYVGFNTVFDKPFSSFYGFTQKDLGELIGRTDILLNPLSVRNWYGGYYVEGEEIYNPFSVMKCLSRRGVYDYYLERSYRTDFTRMADKGFVSADLQEYFHLLIEGKEVIRSTLTESVYLRSVSGDFFSVFVHAGYLDRIPPVKLTDRPIWRVKIPNLETRGIFASGVGKWVAQELQLSEAQYEAFINLLISFQIGQFTEELAELLTMNKINGETKEDYYHNLMSGMVCSLGMKYFVESHKEIGKNKGGNILIPFKKYGNEGIIIEYCVCKDVDHLEASVKASLQDLVKNPRAFTLKMTDHVHVKKILYLTVGFSGSKVLVKHETTDV